MTCHLDFVYRFPSPLDIGRVAPRRAEGRAEHFTELPRHYSEDKARTTAPYLTRLFNDDDELDKQVV